MKVNEMWSIAWENLRHRKLRTSLTTLGVVIGITTIIAIASLGEGFRGEIKQRMEQGFELDVLIVFPGSFTAGWAGGFNETHIEKIRGISNVTLVTPLITIPLMEGMELCNSKTGERLGAFTVGAVNFTEMREVFPLRFNISDGRFPESNGTQLMVLGYKASVVNGTTVATVNENVSLIMSDYFTKNFTVSGILVKAGTSGITNFDYWAFISIEDALPMVKDKEKPYQIILVKVADYQYAEDIAKEIEGLFPRYTISVFVPSALMHQVDNVLNIVQMFLVAIGSISLLVAGVGIMNIMTVSVMERTREIGILKAIGMKSRTVLGMFLAEAVLIGVMGGSIGIFTGYGLSHVLAQVLSSFIRQRQETPIAQAPETQTIKLTAVFSLEWTIIAFIFAILVCIIFGLYPARKAAKLNPVEALRYE